MLISNRRFQIMTTEIIDQLLGIFTVNNQLAIGGVRVNK